MSVIKEMVEAINAKAAEMTELRNSLIDEANGTIEAKLNDNLAILNTMKASFTAAEAARAEEYAASLKSFQTKMASYLNNKANAIELLNHVNMHGSIYLDKIIIFHTKFSLIF